MSLRIENTIIQGPEDRVCRSPGNILTTNYFPPISRHAVVFEQNDYGDNAVTGVSLALQTVMEHGRKVRQSYKVAEVEKLLNSPVIDKDNILAKEQLLYLTFKMSAVARYNLGIPDSFKAYKGHWYFQGVDGTCVPWTIVHSLNIKKLNVDSTLVAKLFNAAIRNGQINRETKEEEHGMLWSRAAEIIDSSANPGFRFLRARHSFRAIPKNFTIEDLEFNARIIKMYLDAEIPLVTGIKPKILFCTNRGAIRFQHAVCVAGYRINAGVMDVQLLDSSNGIYWVPLEHFCRSLNLVSGNWMVNATDKRDKEKKLLETA